MSQQVYNCGVHNCGNGECLHCVTQHRCPHCGKSLIEVTTTGYLFCSNSPAFCDYERAPMTGETP